MLATAATAQGVQIKSMEDLSNWMDQQQPNDPQVFLPKLNQRLESMVGNWWLFNRSLLG